MILSIGSSLESFKRVEFHEGLNVLVADSRPDASEGQTRNSAGKTSLVEVLHFLLGADCGKGALLSSSGLVDHSFIGEFEFWGSVFVVERTGSQPLRVYLVSGFDSALDLPVMTEKDTGRQYMSNKNWKRFLGKVLFGLPLDVSQSIFGESYTPSFRSMFSYFARREEAGAFIHPERQAEKQQRWDWQENLSYLFDLDWQVPHEFQKVRFRESALEQLRKAAKSGALGEIVGTVAELRPALAVAERKATQRREQLGNFRVLDSYNDLAAASARAKTEIQSLTRETVILRETLQHLERALQSESAPDPSELEKVYDAVGVELPGIAIRRLSEVKTFYASIIENRRLHLSREIEDIRARLSNNQTVARRLDEERGRTLKILESHGALEDFVELQKELAEIAMEASALGERFKAAEILEGEATQLEIDRKNLHRRLQQDFQERKTTLDEAILLVAELISGLYDDRNGRFEIDATDNGPEFKISIEGDRGGGIAHMEIFCLDMSLLVINAAKRRGPGFLLHDSHLFDGVDERQISSALALGAQATEGKGLQYIVTMNSDIFNRLPLPEAIDRDGVVLATRLSDQTETGGLFGFRFE